MKKTFTSLVFMTLGLFLLLTAAKAQQYDVPGTYATVLDACNAIEADLTSDPAALEPGSEVTIMVAEGTIIEADNSAGWTVPVKVIVQGAGVDKTFIESFRGDRIVPGEADDLSTRFMELTKDVEGVEVVLQDITFRFFGRGDNDNGGLFSTSSSKGTGLKVSLINCVFDRCGAKQGAIWHGANGTHEFLMENCLVIDCIAYGGSAFAGMIAVDNGGMVTITNSTFISNDRHPWDHRANPDNPIDKGAGRGGVIKVQDGTLRNVEEPYPYSPLIFTLENTAFVNNLPLPVASDSIHPAIEINVKDTALCEIVLIDNIAIGNRRQSNLMRDVDMILPNSREFVSWDFSGNIMNSVVSRDEEYTYLEEMDGLKINTVYTYTHPSINFTMDGDLPMLILDEFGIGHVEYSGDGSISGIGDVVVSGESDIRVYPNPSSGQFDLVLPTNMNNSRYELFDVTGSVIKSGVFYSDHENIDLSTAKKGIYFLRIKNDAISKTIRLLKK